MAVILALPDFAKIPYNVRVRIGEKLTRDDAPFFNVSGALLFAAGIRNYDLLAGLVDARDQKSLSEPMPGANRTLLHILLAEHAKAPVDLLTTLIGRVTVASLLEAEHLNVAMRFSSFDLARQKGDTVVREAITERVLPLIQVVPDPEKGNRIRNIDGLNARRLKPDLEYYAKISTTKCVVYRSLDPAFVADETVEGAYRALHSIFGPTWSLATMGSSANIALYAKK